MKSIRIQVFSGPEARKYLNELALLRIKIFKDFPYLYDGNLDYEKTYLDVYFNSQHSAVILCFDDDKLIGASTVISLKHETESIKRPFVENNLNLEEYVYFGESILEPAYRGKGIGKAFFEKRKEFAKKLKGIKWAVFCAVIRSEDDSLRPTNYSPLNIFWKNQGFEEWTGLKCSLSWKRIDEAQDSVHELQFWRHQLEENL